MLGRAGVKRLAFSTIYELIYTESCTAYQGTFTESHRIFNLWIFARCHLSKSLLARHLAPAVGFGGSGTGWEAWRKSNSLSDRRKFKAVLRFYETFSTGHAKECVHSIGAARWPGQGNVLVEVVLQPDRWPPQLGP